MANTASMPAEGQICMTSYERSLRDLDEGRVYEAKDVDDLFKQCLG